ncbi:MAG: bifunctional heptose 7-phosphate kinase/heptose 1-phosphate adenyltransferase [Rickettsiales bacterium]|nr:bifunctional heptose 7-phosphate kinase/heptose 1-phosphate adenyltransferase [Rickettsiales bacterium]|tara:strand:+ start:1382 stop:2797 length:1416 start_codon:yes stop_codon:yes gene_type:complete
MLDACEILCLGDIILDTYCEGLVERISPEAPIPILKVESDKKKDLGGSGNVARNITAAGNKCHLISIVGNDSNAKILRELCKKTKDLTFELIVDKTRCTTKKQRFVSDNQQILRVDSESKVYISNKIEDNIFDRFLKKIKHVNVVIISDYKKGMLTKSLLKKVIRTCRAKKKIVIIDPKDKDLSIYAKANIITPNQKELFEAVEPDLSVSDYSVEKLSKKIIKLYGFETVITTRSSDGISVVTKNSKIFHLPSKAKEVFDVSGAGDTVVSYIASGIVRKLSLTESVKQANEAAGVAVGRFGTTRVFREEIENRINKNSKICKLNQLIEQIKMNRYKRIGFTNGCFDLIHQGHIDYLKKSSEKCDFFILALNSDSSVKKIKGLSRPIISQSERSEILAHYDFIDRIIIFNEKTPLNIIKKIKPQFLFKGDDYKISQVVGAKEIKDWGGKVILIKCMKGKSTSKIIERIKDGT